MKKGGVCFCVCVCIVCGLCRVVCLFVFSVCVLGQARDSRAQPTVLVDNIRDGRVCVLAMPSST